MHVALVTGAAGFIGSNLTETLLKRGYEVLGIDNMSSGKRRNMQSFISHNNFQFHEGDIRDEQLIDTLTSGADYVYHQAAMASVPMSIEEPAKNTDINCRGTATVLEAAAENNVESVVIASSAAVYGSGGNLPKCEKMRPAPESPYASSKRYTEELAQQFSVYKDTRVVALRYFNVFGPRQDVESDYAAVIPIFISLMLNGERPRIYGDGEQTRDFVYVDTVVEANIRAAKSTLSGEIINVGTGEQSTVNDLVSALNEILETSVDSVYEDPRPGDVKHSYADVSKQTELLNIDDTIGFYDGLEHTVKYYQSLRDTN